MHIRILTFILALFVPANTCAQVDPKNVLLDKDYYENAVKMRREAEEHSLDLKRLIKKLESPEPKVLIDLRSEINFKSSHLKGAVNVRMEDFTDARLKELVPDKNTLVIVYCDNSFYPTRMIALTAYGYPTLKQFGYQNAYQVAPLWREKMDAQKELEPYWEKSK